jgi:hypothetical protein
VSDRRKNPNQNRHNHTAGALPKSAPFTMAAPADRLSKMLMYGPWLMKVVAGLGKS